MGEDRDHYYSSNLPLTFPHCNIAQVLFEGEKHKLNANVPL